MGSRSGKKVRLVIYLAITLAIMVFIFVQSALPAELSTAQSDPVESWIGGLIKLDPHTITLIVRKTAHFLEYLVLGLFVTLTVRELVIRRNSKQGTAEPFKTGLRRIGLISWITGTAYAVSDEIHQYFVPGRSCEIKDMIIDAAGVFIGVLIICLVTKRKTKRSNT
ncbi:MAG: VanZ family protein [Lachnospiraceae bacterium]|nr:VanZ family protein [Lachnospiraceae bacterium]